MLSNCKKDGIILCCKRSSSNLFLVGILFSTSIFLKVFIVNNQRYQLAVGHQIFGHLYSSNSQLFFKIESLEGFIGLFFWSSELSLFHLAKLIDVFLNLIPENLVVEDLYPTFLQHAKLIIKKEIDVSYSFRDWIAQSIS